jgi:ABC-type transport system involved in multi-copper enzyme maturation permease subunit
MNAPPPLFTLPTPVAPNWRHAFGGVWRLTLRRYLLPGRWLTLLIGLAVLALLAAGSSHRGDGQQFLYWAARFYTTFLVPALAFVTAAGVMRDEMKSSSVDYIFTRPIGRPAFVLAKFVAHTVCEQIDFLLALAVVVAFGVARDVPGFLSMLPVILLGQALLITAFSALGFLAAILTSRYIIVGLAYAGIIEVGVGQIPTQISRLSLTRQVRELLTAETFSVTAALGTTATLLLFTLVALIAAGALFRRRELGASAET